MKAYVKPCIAREEMRYHAMVKPMHRYANCIIGVESGCHYQRTDKGGWCWDPDALVILDTEEKYNKFKKVAERTYK